MEPVLLDTDPGIDDAAAIAVAINDPHIDLQLITTVAGNVTVDKTTRNALNLVSFFKAGIPVAAGAEQPLIKPFEDAARIHGESGMGDYVFPKYDHKPIPQTAVEALYTTLKNSPVPMTLIPTGSYTNIALLLAEHPDVKPKIKRIIAMGGALHGGNMTSAAEFNVFTDPEAAEIMYQSGLPIVMVGLDVTMKALLTDETLAQLGQMGPAGVMLQKLFTHYYQGHEGGIPVHDVNTLAYLLHPEFYTTHPYWIDIQLNGPAVGATIADIRGAYHGEKTNANVCETIDAPAFNAWFLREVAQMQTNLEQH
ncbi:purine nucleosidase [Lactobacillus selangorensis]|uniref:Purine nucleosidase n=2 Tax=Lactobacillus selangorensis TaxID=81857 RepID=A0A0R2FU75_9LACO|nr:purine nucleosidase [Lactobacillus selangorensis]KRN31866.1 purine nucleosidase [Lactobacillus selangorensis]